MPNNEDPTKTLNSTLSLLEELKTKEAHIKDLNAKLDNLTEESELLMFKMLALENKHTMETVENLMIIDSLKKSTKKKNIIVNLFLKLRKILIKISHANKSLVSKFSRRIK